MRCIGWQLAAHFSSRIIKLTDDVKHARTKHTDQNCTLARFDVGKVSRLKVRKKALRRANFKRSKGFSMPPPSKISKMKTRGSGARPFRAINSFFKTFKSRFLAQKKRSVFTERMEFIDVYLSTLILAPRLN